MYNVGLRSVVGAVAESYRKRCCVFSFGRSYRWYLNNRAYRCLAFLYGCLGYYSDVDKAVEVASAYFCELFDSLPSGRVVLYEAWERTGFVVCSGAFGVSELRRNRYRILRLSSIDSGADVAWERFFRT